MKKLALISVLALALGGAIAAADPGPNGKNNHGMCTAYFNGSEQGQEKKRQAGPFDALEVYVGNSDGIDNDEDGETDEGDERATPAGVWDWCSDPENNPKGIGGQPDDPNQPGNGGNGKNGRGRG